MEERKLKLSYDQKVMFIFLGLLLFGALLYFGSYLYLRDFESIKNIRKDNENKKNIEYENIVIEENISMDNNALNVNNNHLVLFSTNYQERILFSHTDFYDDSQKYSTILISEDSDHENVWYITNNTVNETDLKLTLPIETFDIYSDNYKPIISLIKYDNYKHTILKSDDNKYIIALVSDSKLINAIEITSLPEIYDDKYLKVTGENEEYYAFNKETSSYDKINLIK